MSAPIIAFSSAPDGKTAQQLAQNLVAANLAACVSLINNITSVYHWQGEIEQQQETILLIKSKQDLLADIEVFLAKHHPYQVPELISCSIEGGSKDYLAWLMANLADK